MDHISPNVFEPHTMTDISANIPLQFIEELAISSEDLINIMANFDDGVLIADARGTILFYNQAMARIDNLDRHSVIGRNLVDVYCVTEETGPMLKCLQQGTPIIDLVYYYRTRKGRAIFSLHNVFPLFKGERRVKGVACFVRAYSALERRITTTSRRFAETSESSPSQKTFANLVGHTPNFLHTIRTAKLSASSPSSIMIYGESGTGKELFAQAIHNHAQWCQSPFIAINCSAIPQTLLEGILFGTSRGAFTDARDKPGLFEEANGGCLFLDEINAMPTSLQSKLLRAIQEKKIRRVGASKEIHTNFKLISSVNVDPEQAIAEAALRMDLFYRLAVVFIAIPPLRERTEDIPALLDHFIRKCNTKLNKHIHNISNDVMELFMSYSWPGNVRELEHVIEGAMNMVEKSQVIDVRHLPIHFKKTVARLSRQTVELFSSPETVGALSDDSVAAIFHTKQMTLLEYQNLHERKIICMMLQKCDGNANQAAKYLGISRQLIYHKMKRHHIQRDEL